MSASSVDQIVVLAAADIDGLARFAMVALDLEKTSALVSLSVNNFCKEIAAPVSGVKNTEMRRATRSEMLAKFRPVSASHTRRLHIQTYEQMRRTESHKSKTTVARKGNLCDQL
jgi:hypothetical protein